MNNHGKYVASLSNLTKWLAAKAEEAGVDVFPAFPGQELLWDGDRVIGVRVGDKGVSHSGKHKSNYEPGPDLMAKVVVLGEGPRGTLTKTAIGRLGLDEGRDPMVYAVGIKELWRVPGRLAAGSVIHTLGAPLWNTFGGGWIYAMSDDIIDIGLVTGLDYADPTTDPHDNFNRYKLHPAVRPLLEGGEMIRYGAKAIPEGGLHAMPRFYADGLCIVGDSAGFLNGLRLKGIHLAIKSGMMASEAIFAALQADDTSAEQAQGVRGRVPRLVGVQGTARGAQLPQRLRRRHVRRPDQRAARHDDRRQGLRPARQALGPLRPREPQEAQRADPGAGHQARRPRRQADLRQADRRVQVAARSTTRTSSPHLHVADTNICAEKCTVEYGNPCQYFCPAKVYEPHFTKAGGAPAEGRLQINFSNCVHCKTCDIMDPYQIITWVPPQGGEGPVYTGM